jgi:hypothetical protein
MSYFGKLWIAWSGSMGLALLLLLFALLLSLTYLQLPVWAAVIVGIALIAAPTWLADRYGCPECGTSIWRTPRIGSWGIWFAIAPPRQNCRKCGADFSRLEVR